MILETLLDLSEPQQSHHCKTVMITALAQRSVVKAELEFTENT